MIENTMLGPYKETVTVKKWHDGESPETDEPYETLQIAVWYDEHHNVITDPLRIQQLEEKVLRL